MSHPSDNLSHWPGAAAPTRADLSSAAVTLAPLEAAHLPALWRAFSGRPDLWDYMFSGPFADEAEFTAWGQARIGLADPFFYAIRPAGGDWSGLAAFMRMDRPNGVIEVGSLTFGPALQRSRAASEAMFLMMAQAFALGYRRYEWKCNSRNLASRRAAQRLGFSFEGVFRNHMVVKGQNRDTAWFAVTDGDWPALQQAHAAWSAPENFDEKGCQINSLSHFTAPLLQARDPVPG